jgi:hypothetical protein
VDVGDLGDRERAVSTLRHARSVEPLNAW